MYLKKGISSLFFHLFYKTIQGYPVVLLQDTIQWIWKDLLGNMFL